MPISKLLLEDLSNKIEMYNEARGLLKSIIFEVSPVQFFSIRFLVLSLDESYLISPTSNSIEKIDVSLKDLNFKESDMMYIDDINPILGQKHLSICKHIDAVLDSYIPIRFFDKMYFGLKDINKKWKDSKVLLLFFVDKAKLEEPFYVSLIYEFYEFVQFKDTWTYNDVYRISEDAALLTLQKTLPIHYDLEKTEEFQRKFVILDLITRTINDIATLYYESSQCNGYFQFIENKQVFCGIELKNKITFYSENDRIIRKLLETAKSFPLVVMQDKIVGIATDEIVCKNKYTIHIIGHLTWEYRINDIPQFVYRDSMYKYPYSRIDKKEISNKLIKLFDIDKFRIKQFLDIIDFSCNGHGALLIITDNAKIESQRLCNLNRGILVEPFTIFDITQQVITEITSIDGAIILDITGKCYAFGVILDGNAIIHGSPSRGARYNSAKNYIAWKNENEQNHKYMAVVISEDGMVNTFPTDSFDTKKNYFSHFDIFKE